MAGQWFPSKMKKQQSESKQEVNDVMECCLKIRNVFVRLNKALLLLFLPFIKSFFGGKIFRCHCTEVMHNKSFILNVVLEFSYQL